jgi:hypothetical protein
VIHLFFFDSRAAAISPHGNRGKIRTGDWKCILCRNLKSFCEKYETECPGIAVRASLYLER